MKEPNNFDEIVPGMPIAAELRTMALRQQQQIDSQHQLLAAKEQRLRFLKAQEARGTAEGERLRRLRERVEAQESKLRRLRALRGQVDLQKTYNVTLGNDLDSIRALFSEKEKELTLAVAKVEALTRQLEDLRRDRRGPLNLMSNAANTQLGNSPAARELEKLRRELMYRNQLSLQQDARLHLQREALHQRQSELRSVDQRILELQGRLSKKRALNQQNQHQQQQQHISPSQSPSMGQAVTGHIRSSSAHIYPQQRVVPRGNIVAVEPYNHTPQKPVSNALTNNANKANILNNNNNNSSNSSNSQSRIIQDLTLLKLQEQNNPNNGLGSMDNLLAPESDENKLARQKQQEIKNNQRLMLINSQSNSSDMENDVLQTMPYYNNNSNDNINNNNNSNTSAITNNNGNELSNIAKISGTKINLPLTVVSSNSNTNNNHSKTNECDSEKVAELNDPINKPQIASNVHNSIVNLMNNNKSIAIPATSSGTSSNGNMSNDDLSRPNVKPKSMHHLHNIPSGNLVVPPRKPISSVAPTLAPKIIAHSPKVNMVAPQTSHQNIQSPSSELLDKLRPALPPKPNKPVSQPQQSVESNEAVQPPPPTIINVISKAQANTVENKNDTPTMLSNLDNLPIKAKPLTIKKQPLSEQPKLRSFNNNNGPAGFKLQQQQFNSRRIEMPPSFLFPEVECAELKVDKTSKNSNNLSPNTADTSNSSLSSNSTNNNSNDGSENNNLVNNNINNDSDEIDKAIMEPVSMPTKKASSVEELRHVDEVLRRKRNIIAGITTDVIGKIKLARRVSFDPLALLLDASLEGELELVKKTAMQVPNPSSANDEGITALHNAICAGHVEIVKFLVEFGCDVNAQDSDGWTPLHCAASCNNLAMVKFLVESGACLFAATLSDHETPAEKCEEDEEGFDGCSEYLYSIQEKLGILNSGVVYAVFSYDAQQSDELSFEVNERLTIIRKGDEAEREWWWAKNVSDKEGYVPRNLFGLYPRITYSNNNLLTE